MGRKAQRYMVEVRADNGKWYAKHVDRTLATARRLCDRSGQTFKIRYQGGQYTILEIWHDRKKLNVWDAIAKGII